MNKSQPVLSRGRFRCALGTMAAMMPLPLIYALELGTRNLAFRSSGLFQFAMFFLLISIPIIFVSALGLLFCWVSRVSSPESGVHQRHVISAGAVAAFHGIYITGFFLSPWPVAISGM